MAVGILPAFPDSVRRLDALLGRAIYRDTILADNIPDLGARLERELRARYEPNGFAVRIDDNFGSWFLHAHRGLTAGFGVGLIPTGAPDRESTVLVGVGRSSRLDSYAGWLAAGLALIAAGLSVVAVGATGWLVPGPAVAVIALGILVVVLLVAYQFLIPAVAGFEFLGGGRFTREQMAAIVALVRAVIESDPAAPQ